MAFKCVRQQGKQEGSPPPTSVDWRPVLFWVVSFHVMINNQDLTAARDLEHSRPQTWRLLKVS